MPIMVMKWIDYVIGLPLCLLASPFAQLWSWLRPPRALQPEKKVSILCIKAMGMGTIILTTPAVQSLRRRYPHGRIDLVTFASNKGLAENLQVFDRVYALRTNGLLPFVSDTLSFILNCWRQGYDAALDFEFFSKFSTLLSFFSGARRRIGFSSSLVWRGWLLTDRVYFNHYRHVVDNFLAQAKILGAEAQDPTLAAMRTSGEDEATVDRLLKARDLPSQAPLILVNVNAGDMCLERRWPALHYVELIEKLKTRYPQAWFLFIGAPNEKDYVAGVLSPLSDKTRVANLSGELTLAQLAALMKRSRLLITSESGPLHFAQSLNLPSLSFFGPGPLDLFSPIGPRHKILNARVECSPCLNYYGLTRPICRGNNICMKYIQPAEVEQAIVYHLASLQIAL